MQNGVTTKLRQLADELETGQYKEWDADMSTSNGDSDPEDVQEFQEGDEITIVLVLTPPKKRGQEKA